MKAQNILDLLVQNESVDLQTEDDVLTIWHKVFFKSKKEFVFQLNGKAVFGCTNKDAAIRKIDGFLNRGFKVMEAAI